MKCDIPLVRSDEEKVVTNDDESHHACGRIVTWRTNCDISTGFTRYARQSRANQERRGAWPSWRVRLSVFVCPHVFFVKTIVDSGASGFARVFVSCCVAKCSCVALNWGRKRRALRCVHSPVSRARERRARF